MSDFRFHRLDEHRVGGTDEQMLLSYAAPRSPSGKIYQYSPNLQAAPRLFLIGEAPAGRTVPEELRSRIRLDPGSNQTCCPYSGHIADDKEFVHFEDIEAVKNQIAWDVGADIQEFLSEMTRNFNRSQRSGSLVTIKMETKSVREPEPVAIRSDLLRDLQCDVCQRPYAVYAIALFCPDCGAPNVSLHFRREAALISEEIEIADRLDGDGRQEIAYRLMGNAHEDVLTAFEATLKTVYRHLVRRTLPDQFEALCAKREIGNAFQSIDRAREKFQVLGIEPFAGISDEELELLRVNIQKRHVIGHNLGIADEHYVELTQTEQPGETVHLIGDEIARFADLCLQVVAALECHLLPANNV